MPPNTKHEVDSVKPCEASAYVVDGWIEVEPPYSRRERQAAGISRETEVIVVERFASGYAPAKIARALRVAPVVVQVLLRDDANVRLLRALRRMRARNAIENSGFCRLFAALQPLDSNAESKNPTK